MPDEFGRPAIDWRLVDDLQELGADFEAEGANDTASAIRMAVLVAFNEAARGRVIE
jgi:hypothetical protein